MKRMLVGIAAAVRSISAVFAADAGLAGAEAGAELVLTNASVSVIRIRTLRHEKTTMHNLSAHA